MQQRSERRPKRHTFDGVNYYCPQTTCIFKTSAFFVLMDHMQDEHSMEYNRMYGTWHAMEKTSEK